MNSNGTSSSRVGILSSCHRNLKTDKREVLLRTLEYFQGIMFLITNRVWSLDPAFKSRIHLWITYPPFSMESRIELWKIFILNGSNRSQYRWLNEKFLKEVAKEEINGRQIKNIVRMAYSRASSGKRAMVANDILVGLNALKTFEVDFRHAVEELRCKEELESSRSRKRKQGDIS
jgi:SpoVK/Ycf46/Vps4 family AAA+-type ATPase